MRRLIVTAVIVALVSVVSAVPVAAADFGMYAFSRTWTRTDQPVASGQTSRTWVWGPAPESPLIVEPYSDGNFSGTRGVRAVQYFDKSRMEVTDTSGDANSQWYVTNGLLAKELVTGRMQVGNDAFEQHDPAQINVAGDANDPMAPTYASFTPLLDYHPVPSGWLVTQTVDRAGHVQDDPRLGSYNVTAKDVGAPTGHTVASVFWTFMTSSGPVNDGWQTSTAPLFSNPFFATGYPITEAYWTTVKVGGVEKRVLVQVFERRVLTYTPDNPAGWQVETGNVGQHYYSWRYLYDGGNPLLVQSLSYHQDASGRWTFIGDVRNDALAPYENVKIDVKLLSASGAVESEESTFVDLGPLQGGQQVPFQVWFDSGQPFASAQVAANGNPGSHEPIPQLSVVNEVGSPGTGAGYRVTAIVRNDGATALRYVSYAVALYDRNGWVVGYDWGVANPATLQAGQDTTVAATILNAPASTASFRVFAAGSP